MSHAAREPFQVLLELRDAPLAQLAVGNKAKNGRCAYHVSVGSVRLPALLFAQFVLQVALVVLQVLLVLHVQWEPRPPELGLVFVSTARQGLTLSVLVPVAVRIVLEVVSRPVLDRPIACRVRQVPSVTLWAIIAAPLARSEDTPRRKTQTSV